MFQFLELTYSEFKTNLVRGKPPWTLLVLAAGPTACVVLSLAAQAHCVELQKHFFRCVF
jgi:hypothetical protein